MEPAVLRAAGALLLASGWLLLLFTGYPFGGAGHLLLVGAVVLFPWRWLRRDRTED